MYTHVHARIKQVGVEFKTANRPVREPVRAIAAGSPVDDIFLHSSFRDLQQVCGNGRGGWTWPCKRPTSRRWKWNSWGGAAFAVFGAVELAATLGSSCMAGLTTPPRSRGVFLSFYNVLGQMSTLLPLTWLDMGRATIVKVPCGVTGCLVTYART